MQSCYQALGLLMRLLGQYFQTTSMTRFCDTALSIIVIALGIGILTLVIPCFQVLGLLLKLLGQYFQTNGNTKSIDTRIINNTCSIVYWYDDILELQLIFHYNHVIKH